MNECRSRKQQRQNRERQDREHAALRLRERIAPLEGVALIEKEHADQDTAGKAGQAQKRVEVAARKSEDHAERAAEKHQASDHHEHTEHKAGHGRAAAARRKFLLGKCHEKAAKDQTDDLGPDVLHGLRRVKPQRARRVAQEAGHAEAHVLGIPEQHQQRRDRADDETGENHVAFFVFERHRKLSFFLFVALSQEYRSPKNCPNRVRDRPTVFIVKDRRKKVQSPFLIAVFYLSVSLIKLRDCRINSSSA